jgi:cytochrome c556
VLLFHYMKYLIAVFLFSGALMANSIIDQRQQSMQNFKNHMKTASNLINEGIINEELADVYDQIAALMTEYPTLFPDNSFEGKTRASSNIIAERVKFNQLAEDVARQASLAKSASLSKDIPALQQAHQNLFSSCKSCHSRYQR